MKYGIKLSRIQAIVNFFLIALICLHCGCVRDRQSAQDSRITLLCLMDGEQSIFRDGQSTHLLMFIPLVDRDEEGNPQPRLLERWEHTDDFTEWTFYLRKDVKWHDGRPVTADDVKFTLELLTDPNISYEYKVHDEVTVIDEYTCLIRSSKPFDALIYSWYGVCPKHLLEGLDTALFYYWDFWDQPVGSGPYRYVRHIPDMMVELEANPEYYGGKPKIERLVLKYGQNPLPELLSGNVDAVNNIAPLEMLKMTKQPQFNVFFEFNFNKIYAITWNHQNPLFQNASVRRALTLAINRQELKEILYLPDSTPVFDVVISRGQAFRGEVPAPLPYDLKRSQKIFDEAGWVVREKDGIREKGGREFQFSLIVGEKLKMAAVYIQDQLQRAGIRMEIITLERSVWKYQARAGEFDAILSSIFPLDFRSPIGGYDNPEFIRLQEAAAKAPDTEKYDLSLRRLWPIYNTDIPVTFLYPQTTFNIVHKRIRGLEGSHRTDPAKYMEYLWIENDN